MLQRHYFKALIVAASLVGLLLSDTASALNVVTPYTAVDSATAQTNVNQGCTAVTVYDIDGIAAYFEAYVAGGVGRTVSTTSTTINIGSWFEYCYRTLNTTTSGGVAVTYNSIQSDGFNAFGDPAKPCVSGALIAPSGGINSNSVPNAGQPATLVGESAFNVTGLVPGRNCFKFYAQATATITQTKPTFKQYVKKDRTTTNQDIDEMHFYIDYAPATVNCPNTKPDKGFGCCPLTASGADKGRPKTSSTDPCGGSITYCLDGTPVPAPPATCTPPPSASTVPHKFMLGSFVKPALDYVRDNFSLPIDLFMYIWADVGQRAATCNSAIICSTGHLWNNGRWAPSELGSDDTNDNKWDGNPNFPGFAFDVGQEDPSLCYPKVFHPATLVPPRAAYWDYECQDHLPMAYEASPAYGGGTNDGNIWIHALKHTVPFFFGYDAFVGGIVSPYSEADPRFFNLDTVAAAGKFATHVNQVQISKTHAAAIGITAAGGTQVTAWQGLVSPGRLQQDYANTLNLPGGSQGPQTSTWDNIKNPSKGGFSEVIRPPFFGDFTGAQNINPSVAVDSKALNFIFGHVIATSLLQDGNGNGYHQPTEPLTYTASITGADDVSLRWEEYADWEQIDNKGHYFTQKQSIPTGAYKGAAQDNSISYVPSPVVDPGSSELIPPPICLTPPCPIIPPTFTVPSLIPVQTGYIINDRSIRYYAPTVESKFGWINPPGLAAGQRFAGPGSAPYSVVGNSYFNPDVTVNQPWASIFGDSSGRPWWQPQNLPAPYTVYSSRDASGATQGPAAIHNGDWTFDQTDPAYTNRSLFTIPQDTDSFPYSITPVFSYYSVYPNGSVSGAVQTDTVRTFPSSRELYENSPWPGPDQIYGLYDDGAHSATKDDTTDGLVDASWQWVDNYRRVHYEVTKDHIRDFGPRRLADPTAGIDCSGSDAYFRNTDTVSCAAPGRGVATIVNPTIEANANGTATGDIYSGGAIDSYFQTSRAGSAFLFAKDPSLSSGTNNFTTGGGKYPGYILNPDRSRVNIAYCDATCANPIDNVFRDPTYATMQSMARPIGPSISGNFNLKIGNNIFWRNGDLTINAGASFCRGAGTILVEGNLIINGDFDYCGNPVTKRDQIASVGFIVKGNITVATGVQSGVGTMFSAGTFTTESIVDPGNLTTSDVPFTLSGLVVALRFDLRRQLDPIPDGAGGYTKPQEETFNYDGRIVVAPPPGFMNLYSAKAVWNEAVPYN